MVGSVIPICKGGDLSRRGQARGRRGGNGKKALVRAM
jgi:hypothetical protein